MSGKAARGPLISFFLLHSSLLCHITVIFSYRTVPPEGGTPCSSLRLLPPRRASGEHGSKIVPLPAVASPRRAAAPRRCCPLRRRKATKDGRRMGRGCGAFPWRDCVTRGAGARAVGRKKHMFSIIYLVAVFAFRQCCRRALPFSYALAPLDSVSMAEAGAFHGVLCDRHTLAGERIQRLGARCSTGSPVVKTYLKGTYPPVLLGQSFRIYQIYIIKIITSHQKNLVLIKKPTKPTHRYGPIIP